MTSEDEKQQSQFAYERSLLFGRYRNDLARSVGEGRGGAEEGEEKEGWTATTFHRICPEPAPTPKSLERGGWLGKLERIIGEDWIFLAILGVLMAICSFFMDFVIEKIQTIHGWLLEEVLVAGTQWAYLVWVGYTLVLTLFSAGFVHSIAPQAIGSGIPEMKTILRGVVLKETLSFRTLVAKAVGLTVSLGSGLPVGKEGPFVHVASIVATLLSKLIRSFKGIFENESRNSEMLAAAAAVGVACTFGAPVGGVLFSIEVTSVYFAVRNYWRGFFAAACSATVFRLLDVAAKRQVTVVAFYRTTFPGELPFYPEELIGFILIGVACGFGGALFVFTHRTIVLFVRNNPFAKRVLTKHRFIYPALVAILVASLTFPPGFGQFINGGQSFRDAIRDFFSQKSWQTPTLDIEESAVVERWEAAGHPTVALALFCVTTFVLSAFANTLPLPAGIFVPVFVVGASFGRLVGEALYAWFPTGMRGNSDHLIIPGGYAVVGAAAFTGAVTHTVSVAVIVFELTGQIVYILPVMLAVLVANAVCAQLQPSIYDSMIAIKHLPYLPDILPTSSAVHRLRVSDIMVRKVRFLTASSTYASLRRMLVALPRLKAFPLVDHGSMVLLGSIPRHKLHSALQAHIGDEARKAEAERRCREHMQRKMGRSRASEPAIRFTQASPEASLVPKAATAVTITTDSSTDDPERSLIQLAPKRKESRFTVTAVSNREHSLSVAEDGPGLHRSERRRKSEAAVPLDSAQNSQGRTATVYNTVSTAMRSFLRRTFRPQGSSEDDAEFELDLEGSERTEWEAARLAERLDLEALAVDPAPFQLVEQTSLYKVHSLFSLLGLNRAYVTSMGQLVGVVALRELRMALEKAQRGTVLATPSESPQDTLSSVGQLDRGPSSESDQPPSEGLDENANAEPALRLRTQGGTLPTVREPHQQTPDSAPKA